MATENDKLILELKKKVEEKKKLIGAALKPVYHTNLSLNLDGQQYNLNAVGGNRDTLSLLMAKLGALLLGYKEYGVENTGLIISGFTAIDWITDLKTKYSILTVKEEQSRLKAMEDKLHNLLSSDTKVSLELEDLAKTI